MCACTPMTHTQAGVLCKHLYLHTEWAESDVTIVLEERVFFSKVYCCNF